jgi:endonuclease III related protein
VSTQIASLYGELFSAYGPQGWWPTPSRTGRKGFDGRGYHRGDYDHPRSAVGRFEVILGAILTQNTAWTNVEKALARLREAGIALPADVLTTPRQRLAGYVRASGYYNQKAKKLKAAAALFSPPGALGLRKVPTREDLLSQWGVGPETADSILLYAFRVPLFVVDAYTRRLLARIGIAGGKETYGQLQEVFHASLPNRHELFNEYHALIVEHAKRHCRARPLCAGCPVSSCAYRDQHESRCAASRHRA